jgi:aminoglycoside phosphotransferase family enzyme/predicted kinase
MQLTDSSFNPSHLLDPAAYPHNPERVRLVETHISWVFIADDLVYKVKKPVDFGFLDYSTLRRRKHFCQEEVRLNNRLCPDAYLGVEKVVSTQAGLRIGGRGRAIEYAVVMRRLPERRMLDDLIRRRQVGEEMIERVAARIADFHATAVGGDEVDRYGTLDVIRDNWQENFDQIEPYVGRAISARRLEDVRQFVTRFLEREADVFRQRQLNGRIRDCHGDMRAESICVTNGLCIFDCIEFNERLRCGDTASEIAFLAMDIDARGRPDLAYWLIDRYIELSDDSSLRQVLLFYASYRAFVRGKVQSFRLDQPAENERDHRTALRRAQRYLRLAWAYARVPKQPLLVLVVGLPGTGKTTVARALGVRLGGVVFSSDRVRKQLAGVGATHRGHDEIDAGLYSTEMGRRTYAELHRLTASNLEHGQSVVLDATYRTRSDRTDVIAIARNLGSPCWIVECQLPESTALARIAARQSTGEGASDADAEVYQVQRSRYEPIDPAEARYARADTSKPIGTVVNQVIRQLIRGS